MHLWIERIRCASVFLAFLCCIMKAMGGILMSRCFLLVAIGLVTVADAQTSSFDGIVDSLDERAHDLYVHGRMVYEMGIANFDCDEINLGGALMLRGINGGAEGGVPVLDTAGCAEAGMHWSEEMAYWHFTHGSYTETRRWYRRALAQATTDRSRVKILFNMGLTYHFEGQIDSAYIVNKRALDYGVENLSSINIVNIAGLSLSLRQPNTALEWVELARERLASELAAGLALEEYDRRGDLIHLSALMAQLDLQALDAAKLEYARMRMRSVFPGTEMEFVHAAMILALRTDDPGVLNLHKNRFEQWLALDSARAVARLGPSVMFFEPWRTDWMALSSQAEGDIWGRIRSLPQGMQPMLNPEEVSDSYKGTFHWVIQVGVYALLLVTAGFAAVVAIVFALMKSREAKSTQALERNLEQTFRDAHLMGRLQGAMSRIVVRRRHAADRDAEEWLRSLSHREREILHSILRNERPKETAELLGISAKTVYAFRSTLRGKFGLPRDDSLEQWVHSKLKG